MEIPNLKVNKIFNFEFYDVKTVDCIFTNLLTKIKALEADLENFEQRNTKNLVQIHNLNSITTELESNYINLKEKAHLKDVVILYQAIVMGVITIIFGFYSI